MDEKLLLGFVNETMNNFHVVERILGRHTNVLDMQGAKIQKVMKTNSRLTAVCVFGFTLTFLTVVSLQGQIDELKKYIVENVEDKQDDKKEA